MNIEYSLGLRKNKFNLNKEKGVEKQQKLKKTKIKRIVKNRKKMLKNARKKPKINQPK